MSNTPDITRKIEEILDEFAKWTINNVEHGIYIPLPSPEAVQKLVTLYQTEMLKLIGDDEYERHPDAIIESPRDRLRAELRTKLKELSQ